MTLKQITAAIYALYLTNKFGYKLKKIDDLKQMQLYRYKYAKTLLDYLQIKIKVIGADKLPKDGQYLLVSNHRTIIDPTIIEIALKDTNILGYWISKKELYNSPFFGVFVRNAGSVLLDRDNKNMSGFFKEVKAGVKKGASMFVFPEGTRNQTDTPLTDFKDGSQIIAIKNRLPILPVFIRGRPDVVLKNAINYRLPTQTIEIEIGDLIDSKDRSKTLGEHYKGMFNLV